MTAKGPTPVIENSVNLISALGRNQLFDARRRMTAPGPLRKFGSEFSVAIMFDERFVTAVNPTSHTKFLTDPRVKGVRPPYDLVLMFAQTTSASVSSATSSLASSGNHEDTSWISTFSR